MVCTSLTTSTSPLFARRSKTAWRFKTSASLLLSSLLSSSFDADVTAKPSGFWRKFDFINFVSSVSISLSSAKLEEFVCFLTGSSVASGALESAKAVSTSGVSATALFAFFPLRLAFLAVTDDTFVSSFLTLDDPSLRFLGVLVELSTISFAWSATIATSSDLLVMVRV